MEGERVVACLEAGRGKCSRIRPVVRCPTCEPKRGGNRRGTTLEDKIETKSPSPWEPLAGKGQHWSERATMGQTYSGYGSWALKVGAPASAYP
jgi:hypothetical protein